MLTMDLSLIMDNKIKKNSKDIALTLTFLVGIDLWFKVITPWVKVTAYSLPQSSKTKGVVQMPWTNNFMGSDMTFTLDI